MCMCMHFCVMQPGGCLHACRAVRRSNCFHENQAELQGVYQGDGSMMCQVSVWFSCLYVMKKLPVLLAEGAGGAGGDRGLLSMFC